MQVTQTSFLPRTLWISLSALLALSISSQFSVPWTPVPVVLSVFVTFMIGLLCTPREAFWGTTSWLVLGAMGAPIFAGFQGGPLALVGPTGGYRLGFMITAVTMAFLLSRSSKHTYLRYGMLALLGMLLIHTCGVCWLSQFVGLKKAFHLGSLPFIAGDTIKAITATLLAHSLNTSKTASA
jgi:biotin transport system substrate-specific component